MKRPNLHTIRRAVQIGTALAFILIPYLNHLHISFVYGNFLCFKILRFPLADPLAVLQITLKNSYLAADLLVGAGIALFLAALLGTVFCSWLCPFGFLSELTGRLFRRRSEKAVEGGRSRRGFHVKFPLFLVGLFTFFLFSTTPVLNQLSLPAWYSRVFQFWFEQGHVSLAIVTIAAILAIEGIAGKRLWCRFICPQSVLISLAKQITPRRLRVQYDRSACVCRKDLHPCARACSLALDPRSLSGRFETECTNCGECVEACKKRGGALKLRFSKKSVSTAQLIRPPRS